MPLYEKQLQALRRTPVPGRYTDGNGLSLLVNKAGGMYWQWQTTGSNGKRTDLSYGPYPAVGLADARLKHLDAKRLRLNGQDPAMVKRQAKARAAVAAANDFETVTRAWFETRKDEWAEAYAFRIISRLEKDVFPWLGKLPIQQIEAQDVRGTIKRIQDRGALETGHRMRDAISMVFRFAIASGLVDKDPAAHLRQVLKKPTTKHMAAITDPEALGGLLRALKGYSGTLIVRTALQLSPMLMVRPGELRKARWEEIDLETATWTIPAARMKRKKDGKVNGDPHIVHLSRQAVAQLKDLAPLTRREDGGGLVFRGERDHERPMSENTVNAALQRLGFDTQNDITGHGFRATARTLLDEVLGFDPIIIEAQLAHSVRETLGRSYNRTKHLAQRRVMLQAWADYLDGLAITENRTEILLRKAA
jgi:integrase